MAPLQTGRDSILVGRANDRAGDERPRAMASAWHADAMASLRRIALTYLCIAYPEEFPTNRCSSDADGSAGAYPTGHQRLAVEHYLVA
jgi:hypothetical protein